MLPRVKVRVLVASFWMVTVAVAFTAGHWSKVAGESPESKVRPAGSEERDPGDSERTASGRGEDLEALLKGDAGPQESETPLGRILAGDGESLNWRAARLQAEFLSPEEARYWVQSYLQMPPSPERDRLLGDLLAKMAESAPLEAMALAQSIGSVSASESARRQILESWGRTDPMAALGWIEENHGSLPARMRAERMESWMDGYADVDPAAAFSYVVGLSDGTNSDRWLKRRLIETVVEAQVEANQLEEALSALNSLPEGQLRQEALQEFYSEWAKQDPNSAAEHFLSNRSEDSERAAAGLIREWASSDPESAAEFVSALETSDPAYQVAISSLIERWSRYDLEGPAQWLNELPPSEEIDRAVAVYSVRASSEDPAGAMTWASSIASENTRTRVMQRVAANWNETDPEGLENYIQESDMDEESATQLREAQSRNRRRGPF